MIVALWLLLIGAIGAMTLALAALAAQQAAAARVAQLELDLLNSERENAHLRMLLRTREDDIRLINADREQLRAERPNVHKVISTPLPALMVRH